MKRGATNKATIMSATAKFSSKKFMGVLFENKTVKFCLTACDTNLQKGKAVQYIKVHVLLERQSKKLREQKRGKLGSSQNKILIKMLTFKMYESKTKNWPAS